MAISPKLMVGNLKTTRPTGKERELVEEAKRLSLDVVAIFSTKRGGSNTMELDDWWKLFYSGVNPAKFAQAVVGILVSPQLANCVDEWIPLGVRLCMLRLKLLGRSLCLIQAQPKLKCTVPVICGRNY